MKLIRRRLFLCGYRAYGVVCSAARREQLVGTPYHMSRVGGTHGFDAAVGFASLYPRVTP